MDDAATGSDRAMHRLEAAVEEAAEDRLQVSRTVQRAAAHPFPKHWSFLLGEVALYSFLVLVATGVYLTFFYEPSLASTTYEGSYRPLRGVEVSQAYESVMRLSWDVRAGLFVRQVHHWAALVFVASIVAHLLRNFFTGAYRRPREINWMVGVTLLALAIFNGFAGYSLLDDLLSGTGLRVGYSIALSVPVVGSWVAFLLFGGEYPSTDILSRLYVVHILLVPALIVMLLGAHLGLVWRQRHTQMPGGGRTDRRVEGSRLWPSYAAKSFGLLLLVAAVLSALGGLVQINPIWLWGPYDPAAVSTAAQPDWYMGWIEGAMRLAGPWAVHTGGYYVPSVFFPAVLLPGLTFLALYAWPFVDRRFTGDRGPHQVLERPSDRPGRTGLGVGVLTFYGILLVAGSQDVIAAELGVPISTVLWSLRAAVLLLPLAAGYVARRIALQRREQRRTDEEHRAERGRSRELRVRIRALPDSPTARHRHDEMETT